MGGGGGKIVGEESTLVALSPISTAVFSFARTSEDVKHYADDVTCAQTVKTQV